MLLLYNRGESGPSKCCNRGLLHLTVSSCTCFAPRAHFLRRTLGAAGAFGSLLLAARFAGPLWDVAGAGSALALPELSVKVSMIFLTSAMVGLGVALGLARVMVGCDFAASGGGGGGLDGEATSYGLGCKGFRGSLIAAELLGIGAGRVSIQMPRPELLDNFVACFSFRQHSTDATPSSADRAGFKINMHSTQTHKRYRTKHGGAFLGRGGTDGAEGDASVEVVARGSAVFEVAARGSAGGVYPGGAQSETRLGNAGGRARERRRVLHWGGRGRTSFCGSLCRPGGRGSRCRIVNSSSREMIQHTLIIGEFQQLAVPTTVAAR